MSIRTDLGGVEGDGDGVHCEEVEGGRVEGGVVRGQVEEL